jgi:hypothetical protein
VGFITPLCSDLSPARLQATGPLFCLALPAFPRGGVLPIHRAAALPPDVSMSVGLQMVLHGID